MVLVRQVRRQPYKREALSKSMKIFYLILPFLNFKDLEGILRNLKIYIKI